MAFFGRNKIALKISIYTSIIVFLVLNLAYSKKMYYLCSGNGTKRTTSA